jgi:hypothetical protein
MPPVVIALVLMAVAVVAALVISRRTDRRPASGKWQVPVQLHRADFADPDLPLLVVLFTNEGCASCDQARSTLAATPLDGVAVDEVERSERRALHDRYGIDAVPMLILADAEGVVVASWVGPVAADTLAAVVAQARPS